MDEYEDIETAAAHCDWKGCAKLMFVMLFQCTKEQQRSLSAKVLDTYVPVWKQKHSGALGVLPGSVLINESNEQPAFPEFPDSCDLDPADAEFENGLLEFYNGAFVPAPHSRYTAHFATSIRSAVTARQINRWLQGHPAEYTKWKAGRDFDGATFFEDEAAAGEAKAAWIFVDYLLKQQHIPVYTPISKQLRSSKQIARLYRNWEESVL
jgi:hypothetical protein